MEITSRNKYIYMEIKKDIKKLFYKLEEIANNQKEELTFCKNDIERTKKLNELIDTQKIAEKLKRILKHIDLNIKLKQNNNYFVNYLLTDQTKLEFFIKLVENYLGKYDILLEDKQNYENWKNLIIKS